MFGSPFHINDTVLMETFRWDRRTGRLTVNLADGGILNERERSGKADVVITDENSLYWLMMFISTLMPATFNKSEEEDTIIWKRVMK